MAVLNHEAWESQQNIYKDTLGGYSIGDILQLSRELVDLLDGISMSHNLNSKSHDLVLNFSLGPWKII